MNWFLVVLFMEWEPYPVYVFTDPTFETKEECLVSATDPEDITVYVNQLFMEYGRPMPVKGVNCISEDILMKLLQEEGA